jgi:hypothetical protein
MKKNVGKIDRVLRLFGAAALLVGAVALARVALLAYAGWTSLPLLGAVALGAQGLYLLFSAAAGTCLGYRLLGRSTCAGQGSS